MAGEKQQVDEGQEQQAKPEAKYTDKDVDEIVSKKFAQWKSKHEAEVAEAQKLAEMNATEKAAYELEKANKRIAELEGEKNRRELAREVRAQCYDRVGGPSGGHSDPTALTAARMDAESRMCRESAALAAIVADARAVCSGVRAANPTHSIWGDVLELRFCDALGWYQLAAALDISESYTKTCAAAALDWVDQVGIAAAREGMGRATLF